MIHFRYRSYASSNISIAVGYGYDANKVLAEFVLEGDFSRNRNWAGNRWLRVVIFSKPQK